VKKLAILLGPNVVLDFSKIEALPIGGSGNLNLQAGAGIALGGQQREREDRVGAPSASYQIFTCFSAIAALPS